MKIARDPSRRASPLRAVVAVLWAFCGIRKGSERDKDLTSIRPLHVIIAGVLMGALFILTITTVVRIVISN